MALDLEYVSPPQLDDHEDIETRLIPLDEAVQMLKNGEFLQAMHVSSFFYALNYLQKSHE